MLNIFDSLKYPIIQAPMAFAQDEKLALAVGRAGGLGSIAGAMYGTEPLRNVLHIMQQSGLPYNVNFFAHQQPEINSQQQEQWLDTLRPFLQQFQIDKTQIPIHSSRLPFDENTLQLIEQFTPPIVSFHFGLPSPSWIARIKRAGAQIWASATTVNEARFLQQHGVDAVIAQGWEAGGHRGWFLTHDWNTQSGLFTLLPAIYHAVDIPVIAAGGIMRADSVAWALNMGAVAVQAGTAFLLATESLISNAHRTAIIQTASPEDTMITNIFSGGAARGIRNGLMQQLGAICPSAPPFPLAGNALAVLKNVAEKQGCFDFSPFWAGQNAYLAQNGSAKDILQQLAQGLTK